MFDLKNIEQNGVIPVATVKDALQAEPLAKALQAAGVNIIEITFRTESAGYVIKQITAAFRQTVVCAGTVRTIEQVDIAMSAGAKFIISPGLSLKIAQYCRDNDILLIPGCATPSEMQAALEMGFNTVKFFPAEAMGGAKYINAVSAAFSGLSFIPTGGINAENIAGYAKLKNVFACGLSGVCSSDLIAKNDFSQIEELTKNAKAAFFSNKK